MHERRLQLWYLSGFTSIVVNNCEEKCLKVKIFLKVIKKYIGKLACLVQISMKFNDSFR